MQVLTTARAPLSPQVLGGLCEHHAAYASAELPALKTALDEALPACLPGAKGKRLACLQAVASALPAATLHELLPALLGEVVLACKELNVKTRAAAFEFLVALSSTVERRAVGGVTAKADAANLVTGLRLCHANCSKALMKKSSVPKLPDLSVRCSPAPAAASLWAWHQGTPGSICGPICSWLMFRACTQAPEVSPPASTN